MPYRKAEIRPYRDEDEAVLFGRARMAFGDRSGWSDRRTLDVLEAAQVFVAEIDGYPVEVTGNLHTIVLVAEDIKGSIARIASILAEGGVNIATLRLTRKQRGGDAFMVIEVDDAPSEAVRDAIRALPWVRWAFRLDKVAA